MTVTTSGGAYYQTAVDLRADARKARESYPEALERAIESIEPRQAGRLQHARALIDQAVGFELAAALYAIAQAIEDTSPFARRPR